MNKEQESKTKILQTWWKNGTQLWIKTMDPMQKWHRHKNNLDFDKLIMNKRIRNNVKELQRDIFSTNVDEQLTKENAITENANYGQFVDKTYYSTHSHIISFNSK